MTRGGRKQNGGLGRGVETERAGTGGTEKERKKEQDRKRKGGDLVARCRLTVRVTQTKPTHFAGTR